MKKVLVYSHDAYGLGNIRRMLEITSHLVDSDPELSVLLISGSPMLHAFRIPQRVDYIKLPCVARSEKGEPIVKTLGLPYADTIRMRTDVIMMAVMDFAPDLILVDKKPFGIGNELKRTLSMTRKRARRPKCVLLLRDILDEPETTTAQWEEGGYHQTIRDYYDQVLVVGMKEVFDAASEYRFPATTREKVRYCGYIRRPAPLRPAAEVRRAIGVGDAPLVLVTAGGGGDGYDMMWNYLTALASRPGHRHKTLLISGPEMSAAQRQALFDLAELAGDVAFCEFTDDMISCINAADVVLSMGGYNTVCELLTLQKRSIIVPRVVPVQEQWLRAERMQKLGLLRAVHPATLTADLLLDAVEEELARTNVRSLAMQSFPLDGLPHIAAALHEAMYGELAHAAAMPARTAYQAAAGARAPSGGGRLFQPLRPRLAASVNGGAGAL